jgi:thioredoxin-like negative regulator of GroEL
MSQHQLVTLMLLLIIHAFTHVAATSHKSFWGSTGSTRRFVPLTEQTLRHQQTKSSLQDSLLDIPRGGGSQAELTLDEKVHAAMRKLGLDAPDSGDEAASNVQTAASTSSEPQEEGEGECVDGVCPIPEKPSIDFDVDATATRIASDMSVDRSLAMAALGATSKIDQEDNSRRTYNEEAATAMIQQELEMISAVSEDSEEVKQLVSEGFDSFLSRRALAFGDLDIDDARAILAADRMDEEEEEQQQLEMERQRQEEEETKAIKKVQAEIKTVTVDSNFDPTKVGMPASAPSEMQSGGAVAKPASKADVIFEATSANFQQVVLESPVPVLLDIYADWCGPCKTLGPILEEMAIKGGGAFRLVKVNSDNERPISAALDVTALPSVFGFKDGKILHSFQGMPRSQDSMKNFMMGLLMPGAKFDPPVTEAEQIKYAELSNKLVKMASAASFSFSARERLQDRVSARLDELVQASGDLVDAEESAMILRSLLSNAVKDPFEVKFRSVNLANKVIASKVTKFPPCLAILKSVGFVASGDGQTMILGQGKKIVNVAAMTVARNCIDNWIDKSRYDIAAAVRKRKDEEARARLQAEGAFDVKVEEEEEPVEKVDPNICSMKIRMAGKNKVHNVTLQADDPLQALLKALPVVIEDGDEVQITCIAKRLVIHSFDQASMAKSLRDLGMIPAASVVVSIGSRTKHKSGKSKLSERASIQKKKQGSHSMHSIGLYAKDDNAKGELVDGGGGTMYEQDVSDDEVEERQAKDVEEQEEEGVEFSESSDDGGSTNSD